MKEALHLLSTLGKLGQRALRRDPYIDEFSASLAHTRDIWEERQFPTWAELGYALHLALETRPKDANKPYQTELGPLQNDPAGKRQLQNHIGYRAMQAIRLLANGPVGPDPIPTQIEQIKNQLGVSSPAFWNAALILLLRRWEALLEEQEWIDEAKFQGRPNRIALARSQSRSKGQISQSEVSYYDGWVGVECQCEFIEQCSLFGNGIRSGEQCSLVQFLNEKELDPQTKRSLSDYHVRILGFGVTRDQAPSPAYSYRSPLIKVRAGSTITATFQVHNRKELVPAPHAIPVDDPPPENSGQTPDPARPRYLSTLEAQAFRLILDIESGSHSGSIIKLLGEYIMDKADVPTGYERAEMIQLNPKRGESLMILVRYRDRLGPGWADPALYIPIQII